mmetsp:Transcript_23636/g.69946  ORF Transcript_23636/g.69946 Transcript_23636/m.69946 type:complete len:259 (+) Transcript_23636:2328-3104(+)
MSRSRRVRHIRHRILQPRRRRIQGVRIPLGSIRRLVHRNFQDETVRRRRRRRRRRIPRGPSRPRIHSRRQPAPIASVHALRDRTIVASPAPFDQYQGGRIGPPFSHARRLAAAGRRLAPPDRSRRRERVPILSGPDAIHPQRSIGIQRRTREEDQRHGRGERRPSQGRDRTGDQELGGVGQARSRFRERGGIRHRRGEGGVGGRFGAARRAGRGGGVFAAVRVDRPRQGKEEIGEAEGEVREGNCEIGRTSIVQGIRR